MIKIIEVLESIKDTKGNKDKATRLKNAVDNYGCDVEDLLTAIRIICDPSVSTNIASKKIAKEVLYDADELLRETNSAFFNFLINECTGKDSDIARCQHFINSFEQQYRKTLTELITQSLSIGMDYKSVNKALGYNFIKVVEPMLALLADKMNDKDKNDTYAVTEKLDGFRMILRVGKDGKIVAYSKNGLPLPQAEYQQFFDCLNLQLGFTYDGEILPSNIEGLSSKEQYKAVSKILRKKGTKDPSAIKYHIFDMVQNEEFDAEESTLTYETRRTLLDIYVKENNCQVVVPVIRKVDLSKEEDNIELGNMLRQALDEGREGLMLNKCDAFYNHKRSRAIFKMKGVLSCDLLVLDVEEGTGKNANKLGAIICQYKDGNVVKVGTGFSDEQREFFWNNNDKIVGKVVEVIYTEETENQDGGKSLRFPRFFELRDKLPSQVSFD